MLPEAGVEDCPCQCISWLLRATRPVAWEAPLEPATLGWAAERGGLSKGKPAPFASPLADLLQPGEDQAG